MHHTLMNYSTRYSLLELCRSISAGGYVHLYSLSCASFFAPRAELRVVLDEGASASTWARFLY